MKNKLQLIEFLGLLGLLMWILVIVFRRFNISGNELFLFLRGVLPNLGAAWLVTAIVKVFVKQILNERYTIIAHSINCLTILLIAVCSEYFFFLVCGRSFDYADIVTTVVAQVIIFLLPILLHHLDSKVIE